MRLDFRALISQLSLGVDDHWEVVSVDLSFGVRLTVRYHISQFFLI